MYMVLWFWEMLVKEVKVIISFVKLDSLRHPFCGGFTEQCPLFNRIAVMNTTIQAGKTGERTANAGESAVASTTERPSSETMAAAPETTTAPLAPAVKTPNRIWKEYTDSLTGSMKGEVLSNKKVKKETYFITVNYEIDVHGAVTVTDIAVAPENGYLQDQLKQRILLSPPVLSPVVDSSNKPRKVKRRYNFTIVKD